ncbi:hypothetical protein cyc_08328 [Cyclospora cayetanensis]|uniref:Uncharacterized protein n=1 Tax=Cyclospora cayetanensis TaxID=88456 RepID=A0A1D3D1G8_9EIME|nr:hypothetical protein cyc_08328 [Cyclospora cayetanensis]
MQSVLFRSIHAAAARRGLQRPSLRIDGRVSTPMLPSAPAAAANHVSAPLATPNAAAHYNETSTGNAFMPEGSFSARTASPTAALRAAVLHQRQRQQHKQLLFTWPMSGRSRVLPTSSSASSSSCCCCGTRPPVAAPSHRGYTPHPWGFVATADPLRWPFPVSSAFAAFTVPLPAVRLLFLQGGPSTQPTHCLQQQVRLISTKRRRYFKMRKFHKKKYKKKLLRSKKVPFVDITKPRRTWKTLKEMQLTRKQFRRGIPGKGARMLRLKRQR